MEINKINSINSTNASSKSNRVEKSNAVPVSRNDKVSISEDSKTHALYKKTLEAVKSSPEVKSASVIREDKIAEARITLQRLKENPDELLREVSLKLVADFEKDGVIKKL